MHADTSDHGDGVRRAAVAKSSGNGRAGARVDARDAGARTVNRHELLLDILLGVFCTCLAVCGIQTHLWLFIADGN